MWLSEQQEYACTLSEVKGLVRINSWGGTIRNDENGNTILDIKNTNGKTFKGKIERNLAKMNLVLLPLPTK